MTNNQHGQVPEALIDLIDAYAETRHRCGGIYNARTEAARKAVIEALSGVQALSAAPEAIAKLRHLYQNMVNGAVRDTASAKRIAEGLLAPAIEALERATPPAEQQAQPGAVYAELPERRRVFLCTKCGGRECESGLIHQPHPPCKCGYLGFAENLDFTEDQMRGFADRTHALRMQAAPKAAPTLPEGWTDCTIEFGNDGPEVVAYGPKRMMNRLAKWLGKYFAQVIADAATKAAPGEPSDADIDAFLDSPGGIEWVIADKRERYRLLVRAVLAKWAAPQQEAQEPVAYVEVSQSDAEVSMTWGPEPAGFNLPTGRYALYASPQPAPAPLSESIDQVERALAIIGVVGAIDGHDVVRRESVLEIARRATLAAQGGE